ncbi:MAG: phytanoyl-CoA dioxygenase family protein [Enterobacterales bacterium]|nr:phytanoyl-CoA dioxygenase family protein [Enterobacterales bacterium]
MKLLEGIIKNKVFTFLKKLMPQALVKKVLIDVEQLFSCQLSRFDTTSLIDQRSLFEKMQQLLQKDQSAYLAAARRCAKLVSLQRYLSDDRLLEAVKQLGIELPTIVTEPIVHINSDKLTIKGGYAGFNTHQDWTSIQGSLDCVVVWAPLVKIDKINFPLQIIAGSHKHGMYDGKITENVFEIDPKLYRVEDYQSVEVEPGDIVVMSSWTLHRTGVENCHGFRLACSSRFDNARETTFIDRGYPCAYQRSVHRELITENFPEKNQIADLFNDLIH